MHQGGKKLVWTIAIRYLQKWPKDATNVGEEETGKFIYLQFTYINTDLNYLNTDLN